MLKLTVIKIIELCCLIMSLCVLALYPVASYAQRGSNFSANEPAPQTPVSDFPGFFDSYTAPQGAFVFDLPSLAMDYGVSDDLTVGINGISALSLLFSSPVGLGKARYRFFSNGRVQSSLTGYLGGFYVTGKNDEDKNVNINGLLIGGSSNTIFHVSDKAVANVSVIGAQANASYSTPTEIDYARVRLGLVYLAIGYEHFITRTMGASLVAFRQVLASMTSESVNFITSQSSLGSFTSKEEPILVKLSVDIVPASRQFLLSPAVVAFLSPGTGSLTYSPWLNFAFKM